MGVITKISIRNMARRKSRYILTTLTLVIGVALFGGVMIVADSFSSTMLSSIDGQMGTADILFRTNSSTSESNGWFNPNDINDSIAGIENVNSIAYRISGFSVSITGIENGNQLDDSINTVVYGIDIDNPAEPDVGGTPFIIAAIPAIVNETSIEGMLKYTDTYTGSRVIIITEGLQIQLGKNISDIIRILPNQGDDLGYDSGDSSTWEEYRIIAVIRDSGEAQDFDPSTGASISLSQQVDPVVFTNIENAHSLVDGLNDNSGKFNLGVIDLKDMYLANETTQELLPILNDIGDYVVCDLKSDSIAEINTTMETMDIMFLIFGIVALILSSVLIVNIFNIIREEQEYETGMFQAIGASRFETFKMFLVQGLIMGTIGALIGTILSYFIADGIFSVTANAMSNMGGENASRMGGPTDFSLVLDPVTVITTFVGGLLACLLSSIYPSYKASRKPIIECLNPIEEKNQRIKKKYARTIIYLLLGIILIVNGALILFNLNSQRSFGPSDQHDSSMATSSMVAPVGILFGVLIIAAIFVQPLVRGMVKVFKKYLKQTRLLTEKNILRHPKRTILTFCLIALTTSYLVGMSVIMDSMRAGVDTTVDDMVGSDIQLFSLGPTSLKSEILNIDQVEEAMPAKIQNAFIKLENNTLIGHDSLDVDYDTTINVNIIDPAEFGNLIDTVKILEPENINVSEVLAELEQNNSILITEEFAKDYDISAGDTVFVNFTIDFTFTDLQAMFTQNNTNAKPNYYGMDMKVVAIVNKVKGAGLSSFMGVQGKVYETFMSWNSYTKEVADKSLPGGDLDLILRQSGQTGNETINSISSRWFNASDVLSILNTIEGLEYTTRMDYPMITTAWGADMFGTPVVGIQTNETGNIKSDVKYGNNQIIEKNNGFTGETLEELLNNSGNVCVVDQEFVNAEIKAGNIGFGIGSSISIFPQDTNSTLEYFIPTAANVELFLKNGILSIPTNLDSSDNVNESIQSMNGLASLDFIFNLTKSGQINSPKPISISIESRNNISIDSLEIQAMNILTGSYETIGEMNSILEANNTFTFNPDRLYINPNPANSTMMLRIIGNNSDINADYSIDIDYINMSIAQSNANILNPLTWPAFEVIGIINTSKLYNAERYFWDAGYETASMPSGTAPIMNTTIYLNYETARNNVFVDYKGSSYANDNITSVLLNYDDVAGLAALQYSLKGILNSALGGNWTLGSSKSLQYQFRNFALIWYVWINEGADQEIVLQNLQDSLEDIGIVVFFGLTSDFVKETFSTMIDLMTFIMYGMLILAIIISLLGLALHCLLTTMSRRREIGMLRSIGLSKQGVVRSISGETLIIALLGVIIGIGAGLLQGSLSVLSIPEGGFLAVTFVIPWMTILVLVLITILAAIGSSMLPARWAANINIIDAVRTR